MSMAGGWPAPLQPLTPLIGRDRELAQVVAMLTGGKVRLLTLVGTGGTGKTRLALAAAEISRAAYDEIVVVALASISDPALVLPAIADSVGVTESADRPQEALVAERLSRGSCLLVLDNFEQVLDASAVVTRLLAACPRMQALVTSREALHVYGEYEFQVPPLALPEVERMPDLETLSQYDAVRLFVERAEAVQRGFAITNANAQAVTVICHRLDGLPLAIELAAARVKHMPPSTLLTRLERRFAVLVGGARDLPARHQTLRNAINWSYDLLDEQEQAVFRGLAVFVDGCALGEAEEVLHEAAGESEVLDVLAALVDKSLLRNEGSKPEDTEGEPRFGMLETIREYALEKLVECGEEAEARTRHMRAYLTLTEELAPTLTGSQQLVSQARLTREYGNNRAALKWAAETGAVEIELRLATMLGRFWARRSRHTEGRSYLKGALSRGEGADLRLRAGALNWEGNLAQMQSDEQGALLAHSEALALRRSIGDEAGVAASLSNLASVYRELDDRATARALLEEALEIRRQIGDRKAMAVTMYNLGNALRESGEAENARRLHMECLALSREIGDGYNIANSLNALGLEALDEGNLEAARAYQEEALQLRRSAEDNWGTASSLVLLGDVLIDRGEVRAAQALYGESLEMYRSVGDRGRVAESLEGLALVEGMNGRPLDAARMFSAAARHRAAVGVSVSAPDRALQVRRLAAIREKVDAAAWEDAWNEGQTLTLEEALGIATMHDAAAKAQPAESERSTTLPNSEGLTAREVEVLRLLAQGVSNSEIAAQLHLSQNTVQAHLRAIYGKIGVNTRSAATRYALERGLA